MRNPMVNPRKEARRKLMCRCFRYSFERECRAAAFDALEQAAEARRNGHLRECRSQVERSRREWADARSPDPRFDDRPFSLGGGWPD